MKLLLTCAAVAACICFVWASDLPPPHPQVDVAALVRQLGSDDFAAREEASRQLAALLVDEPPAELVAALKSADPEVRDRAAKAIKAIRENAVHRRLPRDERFAKRGQVDLYVIATGKLNSALLDEDERLWKPAFDLGVKVLTLADTEGDRRPAGPSIAKDVAQYRAVWKPKVFRTGEVVLTGRRNAAGEPLDGYTQAIQADSVEAATRSISGLVISRGPIRAEVGINSALVLATGDITIGYDIDGSVVVCDGDVRVGKRLSRSVVIARGKITIAGTASNCTLISGAAVAVGALPLMGQGDDPKELHRRRAEIKEQESNPLGFITFFELRRIGLAVKAAGGTVEVTTVAAKSACEKAGLKVGDVVLDVNGKKPIDAESLRRLLRDALAVGDATVKFQRGKETVTAKLSLPD